MDVERTIGSRPHSEPSRTVNVDMQMGGFPYYTTTLSLSNAHPDPPRDSGGSPYYTTMMPYSILQQSRGTQPPDNATKIGVAMESVVVLSKEGDDNHDSILGTESRQTSSSSPVYSKVKKRGKKGRGNEGGRKVRGNAGGRKKGQEEGEEDEEEQELCGEEEGEENEQEREKVEERNMKNEGVQEEEKQPRPSS